MYDHNEINLVEEKAAAEKVARIKKNAKRNLIIVGILLIGLFILNRSVVITHADQYTVVRQFGKIVSIRSQPGPSLVIPLLQDTYTLPKSIQYFDVPVSDVITRDKQAMILDSFVTWKIVDPQLFVRTLGGNITQAENRISNLAYNVSKNTFSTLSQNEIISGRANLAESFFGSLSDDLSQYGIELVCIETKKIDLPPVNLSAVYERMISERQNIAAQHIAEGEAEARKIRTETDKNVEIQLSAAQAQAEKLIAEGEAEYMRILSDAYNDPSKAEFYYFVRSLDAVKKALEGSQTTIILTEDSPIAGIFY